MCVQPVVNSVTPIALPALRYLLQLSAKQPIHSCFINFNITHYFPISPVR